MNIEYTENTKYVEDIVRKHITDPEDCDTVIWCLQKMHIDIDSLVARLKREDTYIDGLQKNLTEMHKKNWFLQQDKAIAAAPGIILISEKEQTTYKLPYRLHINYQVLSWHDSSFERTYNCHSEISTIIYPTNEAAIRFTSEADYLQVKAICEDILEIAKQKDAAKNA